MKERLLLNGIALRSPGISPRNIKNAVAVVAHFADAGLTGQDGTTMSASKAANAVAVEFLVEFPFPNMLIHNFAEGGHRKPLHHGNAWGVPADTYLAGAALLMSWRSLIQSSARC